MNAARLLKQFIKFGIVGTIGAAVDFGSYGLMTRLLGWGAVYCFGLFGGNSYFTVLSEIQQCTTPYYPFVMANLLSVFLAITSNFLLNKFWTFREKTGNIASQGAAYLGMSIVTWTLNQVLTGFFVSRFAILHEVFGENTDIIAKALAILVVLFFNFGGSKIIFRRRSVTATAA